MARSSSGATPLGCVWGGGRIDLSRGCTREEIRVLHRACRAEFVALAGLGLPCSCFEGRGEFVHRRAREGGTSYLSLLIQESTELVFLLV